MEKKNRTVGLLGCGLLGGIVARGIAGGIISGYRLAGLADTDTALADRLSAETGGTFCAGLTELLAQKPDFVVEAAGGPALREAALPVLRAGASLIPLSIGAFADEGFCEEVRRAAEENGVRIYLPSGAIGGFDLIRAAKLHGDLRASVANDKPPRSLQEAVPYPLPEDREEPLFSGSARDAIARFPKNVNVAVAAALAANGPGETRVTVASRPDLSAPRHTIRLEGAFGRAVIQVDPKAGENQRSSTLAAYSVLALLEKLNDTIVFL